MPNHKCAWIYPDIINLLHFTLFFIKSHYTVPNAKKGTICYFIKYFNKEINA